jgi:uncharacterized protein YaiL (DUF2058 family)
MKKQTAVEFLVEQLEVEIILTDKDVENVIKQAKEMEKEQIIDSLHYFGIENAQDYYTETYGEQGKKMYSEEDMKNAYHCGRLYQGFDEFMKQFKNK